MNGSEEIEIIRVTGDEESSLADTVATEKRLRILVNGKNILKLYCSPVMVRELVVGFFMTEGIIEGGWCADRMSIMYGDEITVDIPAEGEVSLEGGAITSGCVGGVTFEKAIREKTVLDNGIKMEKEKLRDLFHRFQRSSELYNLTGCIHSAAVSDGKTIVVIGEDIGRHNAVDKAVGYCLLEDIPLQDKVIFVSGRLSSEMATKCARWGIPLVVSRTAPTALSIDIADKYGITMVGFMRGKRFNIYTHPHRVI